MIERRDAIPLALLGVVVALVYGPVLGRGFTSEDFLILRYLRDGPVGAKLLEQVDGAWLGISAVKFYRPVSTFFFAGEGLLFGDRPVLFGVAHTLLHALDVALGYLLVRRLRPSLERLGAATVAVLFALHPLHPNAVLFAASFATLIGAFFGLLALLLWTSGGERRGVARSAFALVAFALALGSYELAAVLPAIAIVLDVARERETRRPWRRWLVAWAPWWGLLAIYLLFRRALFGEVLGGYAEYGQLLRHLEVGPRLREAAIAFAALLWPDPQRVGEDALRLAVVFAPLGLAAAVAWRRRRRDAAGGLALGAAAAWTLLFLAPFGWTVVIPGTGRYAYLAALGAAWLAVETMRLLLPERRVRLAVPFAAALLCLAWLPILMPVRAAYVAAAEQADAGRRGLAAALDDGTGGPVFCVGYPLYVRDERGTPFAAVFHYGLADSVRPPFGQASRRVYALTEGVVRDLDPLLARGEALTLLRWRAPLGGWSREPRRGPELARAAASANLQVDGPLEGSVWSPAASHLGFASAPGIEYAVLVATEGNAHRQAIPAAARGTATLPGEFLATMRHLYGSPAYWWIEGRDASGRLMSFSVARWLELAPVGREDPRDRG